MKATEGGFGRQNTSVCITKKSYVTVETFKCSGLLSLSFALSLHTVGVKNCMCHTNLDCDMD